MLNVQEHGRRHVKVILQRERAHRAVRETEAELLAGPAVERRAVRFEGLLVAGVVERDARPEGEPSEARLE